MENKKKHQVSKRIPKAIRLVSAIASFLDTGHPVGTHYSMTKLSKEIELKNSNPHADTTRAKITEGFIWKKVLQNYEETYREDRMVDTIKKVEPKDINMATVIDLLSNIQEEVKNLREEIKTLKKRK